MAGGLLPNPAWKSLGWLAHPSLFMGAPWLGLDVGLLTNPVLIFGAWLSWPSEGQSPTDARPNWGEEGCLTNLGLLKGPRGK